MAGGQLWGVWVQPITGDSTPENVQKYGEIEDMAQAYRDGFAKEFCDGQTSPTPPRWPDDGMQLIYTYDRESAQMISDFLRGTLQERYDAGELPQNSAPSWLGDLAEQGLTIAAEAALFDAVTAAATDAEIAEAAELTRSQLAARLADYIRATGNARPTAEDLLRWIQENA